MCRAMEFLVAGLMELVQDRQLPVRRAARRAYSSTVARYHSWVLQRVFGAALHFVHSRRVASRGVGAGLGGLRQGRVGQQTGHVCAQETALGELGVWQAAAAVNRHARTITAAQSKPTLPPR